MQDKVAVTISLSVLSCVAWQRSPQCVLLF